ncbi:hypothetical protein Tco_0851787, partial [Tanacetum coccineum]
MFKGLFELRLQEILQLFNAITVVGKDIMLGIVQIQEFGIRNTSWNKCCGQNRMKLEYFLPMNRMILLFADVSRMEEIEELSANICLMARIQPADHTSDDGPSYESAFISE